MTPLASASAPRMEHPRSLTEAVALLQDPGSTALAGGTWVMRAPIRDEPWAETYVALGGIAALGEIKTGPCIRLGAGLTHAELARATAGEPWLAGVHRAAADSANPAIRRVATLGGNLCALGFAAADLIPALLALDARVHLHASDGERELSLQDFLTQRPALGSRAVVGAVALPRRDVVTSHARLPLRVAGGDYPVAIVDIAVARNGDGVIQEAAVGVGSVDSVARRWPELEEALIGSRVDPHSAAAAAERLSQAWRGRDGVDAPGWYRVRVLPALVRRAMGDILAAAGSA